MAIAVVVMALAWGASAIAVYAVSSGRVFDSASIDAVPRQRAAVVLGCVRTLSNGLDNLYFERRIDAAAELYKAGKVDCLIVSGDNHVKGYDEPSDMKESLAKAGVPADRIVCDYAGFRTLDTVVRAKKVFGLVSFFGPFYADYRVMLIDKDYSHALVGSGGADYLWILSRTSGLSETAKSELLAEARRRGYDANKLIWVRHGKDETARSGVK